MVKEEEEKIEIGWLWLLYGDGDGDGADVIVLRSCYNNLSPSSFFSLYFFLFPILKIPKPPNCEVFLSRKIGFDETVSELID